MCFFVLLTSAVQARLIRMTTAAPIEVVPKLGANRGDSQCLQGNALVSLTLSPRRGSTPPSPP
jgi:hypothetical protein